MRHGSILDPCLLYWSLRSKRHTESRFAKPRNSLLGRAKNCQWQVFVRRRPPKQGELRTDVSKATMFQGEREQKHAQRAAPTGASFLLVRKFPKGKRIVTFCGVQKVTQKARGTPSCDLGSKLYGKIFFVAFPAFVPKPVYGTTRFFGCFEPVRKGYCSTDARLMFFESGMPHYKLTEANVSEKGSCSLSLLGANSKLLCVV